MREALTPVSCGGWLRFGRDPQTAREESIRAEIESATPSRRRRIFDAIALAALGSIPWVGGVISAAATAAASYAEGESQVERQDLFREWLQEHQEKLEKLRATLEEMVIRLEGFGKEVEERITSEQYLILVRKTFREWDEADTEEKRRLLVQLITNAAGTRVCSDDILRLFLDWVDTYHEAHFAVIREIYKDRNDPPTRYDIWLAVYGEPVPRDDSPEADLYKMLIRDLTLGGVIRQPRESDYQGRYKKKVRSPRRASSSTMESPFEDTKTYVLTRMGSQFVHYTMNELVARLGGEAESGAGDRQSGNPPGIGQRSKKGGVVQPGLNQQLGSNPASRLLHHLVALAHEGGDVEVLGSVAGRGCAHRVERNHFGLGQVHGPANQIGP